MSDEDGINNADSECVTNLNMTCGVLTTMHSNIISIRLMNQALVKGFENSVKN